MPTKRRKRGARRIGALTDAQWQDLVLSHVYVTDPGDDGPPFASAVERRAAWLRNRDRLIGECRPGERPRAFWQYERGMKGRPRNEAQLVARLLKAGTIAPCQPGELARMRKS
jgi:hypothetical protein